MHWLLCLTRSAFRLRSAKGKSQGFANKLQLSSFVIGDFVAFVVVVVVVFVVVVVVVVVLQH